MYSKDQASQLKQAFWTTFGQYLAPMPSAEGTKINWINYKTGFKHIHFRMEADRRSAWIGIEITHPDVGMQELIFDQFLEFKTLMERTFGKEWLWELHTNDQYNKTVSRIYTSVSGISVLNREDWPELIPFFKKRLLLLDEFWSDAKYSFDIFK